MLTQTTLSLAAFGLLAGVASAPLPSLNLNSLFSRDPLPRNEPASYRIPLKPIRRSVKVSQQKKRDDNSTDSGLGDEGIEDDMVDGGQDWLYAGVIGFGSPDVQELYIQLDTGSSLLAVYGEEFEANYPNGGDGTSRGAPFVLSQTNATDLGITARYRYADTTYFNATMIQDKVIVGGFVLDDTPFGVMTAGNFSTPGSSVSGILGLGWSTMNAGITPSRTNTTPVVEQLWRSGALKEPLFSFSMLRNKVRDNVTATSENEGGVFTLGELDSSLYSGNVSWKPLVFENAYSKDKPSSWKSQIDFLTVNGKQIVGTEDMTSLFDTGSAAISLPKDVLTSVLSETPNVQRNEAGDWVECPMPFAGPSPLNLTVTYGGQEFPVNFEDLVAQRVNTTDGVLVCQIQISGSTHAVFGAGFLKNVFSAYRFEPPSVGLAHLSEDFLSENPKAGKNPSVLPAGAPWGTPTSIVKPTIAPSAYDVGEVVTATATADLIQTTSFSLSVQPTALGTTTIDAPVPFSTSVPAPTGVPTTNSSSSASGSGAGSGLTPEQIAALMAGSSNSTSETSSTSSGTETGTGSSDMASILAGLKDPSSSGSSSPSENPNSSDMASILTGLAGSSNSSGASGLTDPTSETPTGSGSGSKDIASILNGLAGSSNATDASSDVSTDESDSSSSSAGTGLAALLKYLNISAPNLEQRSTGSEKTTSLLGGLNCTSDSDSKKTDSSYYASSSTVCGSSTGGPSAKDVNKDFNALFAKILAELSN